MANRPIFGLAPHLYIAGDPRQACRVTLDEREKGDWRVSHGALPGRCRWV